MSTAEFLIVFACCSATMLAYRVVPVFALRGRGLSPGVQQALGFIPTAAFAALVANDLFKPELFAQGLWAGLMPAVASLAVVAVALKTRNLLACAVVGVAAYVLLSMAGA